MHDGIERRIEGDGKMVGNDEPKEVIVLSEVAASSLPKIRQMEIEARGRETFELLKLGDLIANLQKDQRKMRLDAEDMRFERDRYKASAASFQEKLVEALNENARLRDLREILKSLAAQMESAKEQRESEDHLRIENARLVHELEQSRVQAEQMRQAFVDIAQGLVAEVRLARQHAAG
ncbi:hypothetical protein DM806_11700 [Sphingobium lactosutens]|uniref:hypothetical protein n=1 Tax=Sphingobium lactosutens TaxID=522773 RepID=UPI0015BDB774|nr:hypothetical protein [Sphingobium lactosutens]NWK96313.1 hypothetical protein [Sphingobium lactosutens]